MGLQAKPPGFGNLGGLAFQESRFHHRGVVAGLKKFGFGERTIKKVLGQVDGQINGVSGSRSVRLAALAKRPW